MFYRVLLVFLVSTKRDGKCEEKGWKSRRRNELVEMQSYTLPPVGTTRYYCSLSRARVLHDRRAACMSSVDRQLRLLFSLAPSTIPPFTVRKSMRLHLLPHQ
jgi:hypothetical protein